MDTHPLVGRRMIDTLVENFGFQQIPYVDSLKALVEYHHEKLDGSGYPGGARHIPKHVRIVTVADIYDRIARRDEHRLEGWAECGYTKEEWRLSKMQAPVPMALLDGGTA